MMNLSSKNWSVLNLISERYTMNKIIFLLTILMSTISWAESRKVVAVLDTGIPKDWKDKDFMCKTAQWGEDFVYTTSGPNHSHGENIVGIISSTMDAKQYCILSIIGLLKSTKQYIEALKYLKTINNLYLVNLSLSGGTEIIDESVILKQLTESNVRVVIASGNDGKALTSKNCNIYPACLKLTVPKLIVVSADDVSTPNISTDPKLIFEKQKGYLQGRPALTGTSQAAANYSRILVSK